MAHPITPTPQPGNGEKNSTACTLLQLSLTVSVVCTQRITSKPLGNDYEGSREADKSLNQFVIKCTAKCGARLLGPVELGWFPLCTVSHSLSYMV